MAHTGLRHHQSMGSQRVFEIADEAGVDVKTVLRRLARLGPKETDPTKRLTSDLTQKLRAEFDLPSTAPKAVPKPSWQPKVRSAPARPAVDRTERTPSRPQRTIRPMPKGILGPEHAAAVRKIIPGMYDLLLRSGNGAAPDGAVVIYHDASLRPEYGLSTLSRDRWIPTAGSGVTRDELLEPLRALDRRYRDRALMPPNLFIVIDVPIGRAWFGQSFNKRTKGPYLDARTSEPFKEILESSPPRLAPRAQIFSPGHVPALVRDISTAMDRPEESFLLHDELLQLAIDSLGSDEQLDPLPVHLNGLWVFARPVIMRRPDDSERHVRAIWYRQGEVVWRLRTFAAGIGSEPKEVGERLFGRLPFVPVWVETRPEQKLLAAVWSLMAQGGITESNRQDSGGGRSTENPSRGHLTVVRVKAGTDHAKVYRSDDPSNSTDRSAWSVRGHWRHQPYPSLGSDEAGNAITKMKWIASYTKGDVLRAVHQEKVIVVRA
jgi:hypothetical protein